MTDIIIEIAEAQPIEIEIDSIASGNVEGPASSIDSNLVEFDGIIGKKFKDGGVSHADAQDAITKKHTQGTDTDLSPAHKDAVTGVHGVGAGTVAGVADITTHAALTATHGASNIADVSDIAVDANLSADAQDAITKKHTQGTDTALDTLGTKNLPVDADKALYRDSAAFDVLVTSTWTQIKAFLKTYFDTLYSAITHASKHTDGSDDIQSATAAQKGLATAAQITKLDGIETGADATPDATETVKGKAEFATNAEAAAKTATDKILVPSNISSMAFDEGIW